MIWYILPGKDSSLYVFSANEFELNRIYTVPIQKVSFFFLFSLFLFYFLCRCTFYSSLIRIFSRLTECIKFSFMGIGIPPSECIHMLREECPAVLYWQEPSVLRWFKQISFPSCASSSFLSRRSLTTDNRITSIKPFFTRGRGGIRVYIQAIKLVCLE